MLGLEPMLSRRFEASIGYRVYMQLREWDALCYRFERAWEDSAAGIADVAAAAEKLTARAAVLAKEAPVEFYAEFSARRRALAKMPRVKNSREAFEPRYRILKAFFGEWFSRRYEDYHRLEIEKAFRLLTYPLRHQPSG